MTNTEFLRQRLLADVYEPAVPIEVIMRTEWNREFEQLMRNRLVMGYLRYGPMKKPDEPLSNARQVIKRVERYIKTGNLEWLVDAANFAMCEFTVSEHPNKHFEAGDDRR